jgi:cation diffusion facilitator CzcD-associated flavoprotein CzcO
MEEITMTASALQEALSRSDATNAPRHVRVAIVGTGFSGLGLAIRLKQHGMANFIALERAEDIGGTWRDNTYPGCACDVPSHLYSFSFAPNPNWSRHFSPQREIWAYLRDCAERFGVTPHIRFRHELLEAAWDEQACLWRIQTSQGPFTANLLALGNGPLSEPSIPAIPGLERFDGTVFHSAQWNHGHDLNGERVAVIGTGASAIQFVPRIQPQVKRLTLFQRTPPWIIPRDDHPISPESRARFRRYPFLQQFVRGGIYLQREIGALAMVYRPRLMRGAVRIAREHLAAQVSDPELRAKLTPRYQMGCKRILLSDDFYPAVSSANVEVVTQRAREVTEHSIVAEDGWERPVDTIILATGFHVTDMPAARYIRGREGRTLADGWSAGPRAYLGTTVSGFPNLFLLIGPNTGLGHTSMIYMIESQLAYILDCLRLMRQHGIQTIEPRAEVQALYNEEVQSRMRGTVWTSGCASWYLDAGGVNSTLWPGFTAEYRWRTRRFDHASYRLTAARTKHVAVSIASRVR